MKIINHRIVGKNTQFQESPNIGEPFNHIKNSQLNSIIIYDHDRKSLSMTVQDYCDPNLDSSAHLLIDRQGKVIQLVPFDKVAFHTPSNSTQKWNECSLSIVVDNSGKLNKIQKNYHSENGYTYPKKDVISYTEEHWQMYTQPQFQSLSTLLHILTRSYPIKKIFHQLEIIQTTYNLPEPHPINHQRFTLLQENKNHPNSNYTFGTVTAAKLNVRQSPSYNAPLVSEPLNKNQSVHIIDEQDGWYKISSKKYAWVRKDYISKN